MRVQRRRYNRDQQTSYSSGATHRIVCGFDKRAEGDKHPRPGKLAGFLIVRDSLGENGRPAIDFDAMAALGYGAKQIEEAQKLELKAAPDALLPSSLRVVLTGDAVRARGVDGASYWTYPNTFAEEFSCWNQEGLFCLGNGNTAMRRQKDGTKREIACVPKGAEGALAEEFCQFSVNGSCKPHSRLTVCLWVGERSAPQSVIAPLGWSARFRLDTSSEYGAMRIGAALDQAADRLNGRISWLRGVLTLAVQKKRHEKGVGIAQQITLTLDEEDIIARERENWSRQIHAAPKPAALLESDALAARVYEAEAEGAPWPTAAPDDESAAWQEHASGEAPPEPRPANLLDDRNHATARVEEPAPVDVGATLAPPDYDGVLPENASYPELWGALFSYALDVANETGGAPSAIIGDLTATPYTKDGQEHVWKASGIDEFRNATGPRKTKFHRLLIDIARNKIQAGDARFMILREDANAGKEGVA